MRPLRFLLREYEWVHLGLGVLGNLTFFVGSLLFLSEASQRVGVWLFIFGSLGMLIGSLGSALVRHERRDQKG